MQLIFLLLFLCFGCSKSPNHFKGLAHTHPYHIQIGHSLTSQDKKEIENIFLENWIFAGHASQIPNHGDFFLFEFDTESVIVTRTKAGNIKSGGHHAHKFNSTACGAKGIGKKGVFPAPSKNMIYPGD